MNTNFKRKLIVGVFVPVLGMAVGTALGQGTPAGSTDTSKSTATTKAPGMSERPAAAASWNAQTFDLLDKNKDGQISREEAQADPALLSAWSKLDASNRGSVSKEEFEKFRASQSGSAPK
jgi:EF hand domain-containing protein